MGPQTRALQLQCVGVLSVLMLHSTCGLQGGNGDGASELPTLSKQEAEAARMGKSGWVQVVRRGKLLPELPMGTDQRETGLEKLQGQESRRGLHLGLGWRDVCVCV